MGSSSTKRRIWGRLELKPFFFVKTNLFRLGHELRAIIPYTTVCITRLWGGFISSIARQPRGYQHRTTGFWKAVGEMFPTLTFLALCSVNTRPTSSVRYGKASINTPPNPPVRFGSNSIPVPDASVRFGTVLIPVPNTSVRFGKGSIPVPNASVRFGTGSIPVPNASVSSIQHQ